MPLPPIQDMIGRLIALPSVSSADPTLDQSNLSVIEQLAEWSEALGFSVSLHEVAGSSVRKVNLVAQLGSGPGGLVLAGHSDTVPYDVDHGWESDPFLASERGENLFGLGTADMKSFLALSLEAVRRVGAASALKEPIFLVATADEECTMAGARSLQKKAPQLGRVAIIGEPTSLQPISKHKGMRVFRLTVLGKSGHSSNPALGKSALEGMQRALSALTEFRRELQARYRDADFEVPEPTLNFGRISGGDAANRICAQCELLFDLRVLPGMDDLLVQQDIAERLTQALAGTGLELALDPMEQVGAPPFALDQGSPWLPLVEGWSGRAAGAVAFATEAPFFQSLGVETVVLGPGSIDVAHRPNEYLPLSSIEPTVALLERAIASVCLD